MVEIEKYPCDNKRELERKETEMMIDLKAQLNVIRSFITDEESKQYHKQYEIKNRGIRKTKRQETVECECGCSLNRENLGRHKRTYKHKQLLKERQKHQVEELVPPLISLCE
tara:strand:- start:245 stop:580 length:336 start_codon:yes stop_codon:yes gene_type:complete